MGAEGWWRVNKGYTVFRRHDTVICFVGSFDSGMWVKERALKGNLIAVNISLCAMKVKNRVNIPEWEGRIIQHGAGRFSACKTRYLLPEFPPYFEKMKALVSAQWGHSSLNMDALRVFFLFSYPLIPPPRFIHMWYLVKVDVQAGFFLQGWQKPKAVSTTN